MSDGVRWASRSSTGTVRIRMHNKLAALVALGKYLGMFDEIAAVGRTDAILGRQCCGFSAGVTL
jgi:hypothetical protein